MVIFPKFLEPPSFETTGRTQKVKAGPENGTDMLYPHAKFGGNLPPHGGEKVKNGCFFRLFVCHAYGLCISRL